MQELIPNAKILEIAEEINNEVWKSATKLNKGPIKLDHNDVRSSVQTAMLLIAMREIRDELQVTSHAKRMESLPNSMFVTKGIEPK
jgi:hypothetical protein